jgi:uncharacterized protein YjbI with pentapeptide repeats
LTETTEGLLLSEKLLGQAGRRATAEELIARLGRSESKPLLGAFEERMYGIDERMRVTLAQPGSAQVEAGTWLKQIVAEELPFVQTGNRMEVGAPRRNQSYLNAQEAFLEAKEPPTLALSRMKGRKFDSGSKFTGLDLRFSDLTGIEAPFAEMKGTNLEHAFLKSSNLQGANLQGAELARADLSGAKLKDAQLMGANLAGANLEGAHLTGADLSQADLRGANLAGVAAEAPYFTIHRGTAVKLEGAIMDAATKLPASWGTRAELEKLGVVFVD